MRMFCSQPARGGAFALAQGGEASVYRKQQDLSALDARIKSRGLGQ